MKKLFLLIAFFGLLSVSIPAVSQNVGFKYATETLTNADTVYASVDVDIAKSGLVAVQAYVSRTSGTLAGNVVLQGSIIGNVWETVIGSDTGTMTNSAIYTHTWPISTVSYARYRIQFITSGTVAAKPGAGWLYRTPR